MVFQSIERKTERNAFRLCRLSHHRDVIKAAELRVAMTSMGERLSYEEATELVIDADPEGTGKVDTREFAQLLARADE